MWFSSGTTALLSVLTLSTFTTADKAPLDSPAAYFTYTQDDVDFVYALNIDKTTGDLYMHMSIPAVNSWVGVGIGSQMKGALMFIAYPSSNGTGVTLSPRVASGHSEPSYYDGTTCELVYAEDLEDGNTVTAGADIDDETNGNGTYSAIVVNAVCHNATHWELDGAGGDLTLDGTADLSKQPFIFAVGPENHGGPGGHDRGDSLRSNSMSAGLNRHAFYGQFTMDLTKALSNDSDTAGVPRPNVENDNPGYLSYVNGQETNVTAKADHDPAPIIHGFIMCFAFVIVFNFGAIVLRVLHRVILHAIVQGIGLFLVICATAGGIVISQQYNRSKHFTSAHQIIGILLFLALIAQLGLGIIHHRIFKKQNRPTTMGKIHKYLGPISILIGIINAPLGFVLAGNPHLCLPYAIVLILVIIATLAIRFGARWISKRRQNKQGGGVEGYQQPQFVPGPYAQGPPPGYSRQPSYGGSEDVPLQPYASQQSGINAPPAYPRQMV